ncbi:MAG: glycosyltransferase [Verrucomicrobiota bacterium]
MKILHVITTINRGGAENHLLELARGQRSSGLDVSVAYLRGGGYWADTYRELGVEVHDLGLRYYGQLAPLSKLMRVIRGSDFDLIHAHLPPAELYTRLALLGTWRWSVPFVISKHNDEGFYRGPGERFMGRWVARRSARVICISQAVNRFMAGPGLGLAPEKLRLIYYGIDEHFAKSSCAKREGIRTEWGIPEGTLAIGFTGRLVPQKDLPTLIRGFALFASQIEHAKLVMVGIGELEAELKRLAEEIGIADRIVWAGFREDIPEVMSAFDVFALTSHYEGFGLVLLEAMISRLPVVATRVSAIPEIVVDGETGLLINPHTPEALASALCKLCDTSLRTLLGDAGRQRVLREFTIQRMVEQTIELYDQCVNGREARRAP